MDALPLAAEFPAATEADWRALVEGVLKGADFERRLVSRTADGLRIAPLYPKAETPAGQPWRATAGAPWGIVQRVDHPDPAEANALALADLEGGADGLGFLYRGAPAARGAGVAASTLADLERVLSGIMLDLVTVRIETAPFGGRLAAAQWTAFVGKRGLDPKALSIEFGLDPLGDCARTGGLSLPWPEIERRFAGVVGDLRAAGFRGPFARIDTRAWHEAGTGEAQELAAALATGVAYLRALEAGGHPLAEAEAALSFLLVADADQFLSIAKFRALRRLWARVQQVCGLPARPIRLVAETAWRMTSRRDPFVNILRGTIAAFSAGIGGADAVTVLPFTAALGLPDAFARRLARNTQAILLEESNLWRVADPAAGSGGFEALTGELCEAAWTLFQEIEREGGMAASLAGGGFAEKIAAARTAREKGIAHRRIPLTGTSEFPHLAELPVAVLDAKHADRGAESAPPPEGWEPLVAAYRDGRGFAGFRVEAAGTALPSRRDAEPFEALRDRSDDILARTGQRPRIFLALLGTIAQATPRATFVRNLFEAGGIEAVDGPAASDAEAVAAAFAASGARLACLCSTEEVYADEAEGAARVFARFAPARLYLAGRPGEREAEWRAAGIDEFLVAGGDALDVLRRALEAAAPAEPRSL